MTHRTPRIPISGERLVLHDRGKVLTRGGVCSRTPAPTASVVAQPARLPDSAVPRVYEG
jgi:hypothetical protein